MRYGIVINLDYQSHPYESVKLVFDEISRRMVEAGFQIDGRVFTANMGGHEACALARNVVDALEQVGAEPYSHVYSFIKEFYGFDYERAVNLLVPGTDDIGVVELDDLSEVEIIHLSSS